MGRTPRPPCGGLAPLHCANARYFRLAAPKKCFGCAVCDVVYVRVGECAAVEEGSSSFLGFFGRQTFLVVRFESRLWPDSTTGLFWYKPENRVSLGGTLRRRSAVAQIGKPRVSRRHTQPPVCSCGVQTGETRRTLRQRCASQFPSELWCQPVGMLKQQMSLIEHTETGSTRQTHRRGSALFTSA